MNYGDDMNFKRQHNYHAWIAAATDTKGTSYLQFQKKKRKKGKKKRKKEKKKNSRKKQRRNTNETTDKE